MLRARIACLTTAAVLALSSIVVHGQQLRSGPWNRTVPFITPFAFPLAVPDSEPRRRVACRSIPRGQCAPMLISGGNGQGGLPTLDPSFTAASPHVRVSFVLQRFQIVGDAAANLAPNHPGAIENPRWETHSPVADQELGKLAFDFDGPTHVDEAGYFFTPLVIYDALIFNACDTFSSFPVHHHADFDAAVAFTTPFAGFDDSTIDSTGYYNFNYTVKVVPEDTPTSESGLHMSGKVAVTCTAASAL